MAEQERGPAIIALTRRGVGLSHRLGERFPQASIYQPARLAQHEGTRVHPYEPPVGALVARLFASCSQLVLIMAVGIAVRSVAPLLKDKRHDPAVVVLDEQGRYAISLLSGHVGGANQLAQAVAAAVGAQPIITTASDGAGTIAPDLLGQKAGWQIEGEEQLTRISAALVNEEEVWLVQESGERDWWPPGQPLPGNVRQVARIEDLRESACRAALIISYRLLPESHGWLAGRAVVYRPRALAVGLGCIRNSGVDEVEKAVESVFLKHRLARSSVGMLATASIKRDEQGITEFAARRGLPVTYFSAAELQTVVGASPPSAAVQRAIGAPGVCEQAAILAGGGSLVVPKQKHGGITVAVAEIRDAPHHAHTETERLT